MISGAFVQVNVDGSVMLVQDCGISSVLVMKIQIQQSFVEPLVNRYNVLTGSFFLKIIIIACIFQICVVFYSAFLIFFNFSPIQIFHCLSSKWIQAKISRLYIIIFCICKILKVLGQIKSCGVL